MGNGAEQRVGVCRGVLPTNIGQPRMLETAGTSKIQPRLTGFDHDSYHDGKRLPLADCRPLVEQERSGMNGKQAQPRECLELPGSVHPPGFGQCCNLYFTPHSLQCFCKATAQSQPWVCTQAQTLRGRARVCPGRLHRRLSEADARQ